MTFPTITLVPPNVTSPYSPTRIPHTFEDMSHPRSIILALIAFAASFAAAQNATPTLDNAFVQKQFGASCSLLQGQNALVADLDGDGVADIVIPAKCKNPMLDESENNFAVVDPYNSFFGYGNPHVTSQFVSEDPDRRGVVLLVIHGLGPDAWHADTPKAKYLIINLPYKDVTVRKLKLRKKSVLAIYVAETGSDEMTSATFWDGKKYRYMPLGGGAE